jgi:hypothetical protein
MLYHFAEQMEEDIDRRAPVHASAPMLGDARIDALDPVRGFRERANPTYTPATCRAQWADRLARPCRRSDITARTEDQPHEPA